MDGGKFDGFVRMLGSGASRRRILQGLLGLGGAAIGAEAADARTLRTRPTIPPPPPPPPPTTSTTPAPLCGPGQEQCPFSTQCCPTGTCARSGNSAICCDGNASRGSVVCGLECCQNELECCDGECCAAGNVCLVRVFGEGPFVEEEVCCPASLTCRDAATGEGLCCTGECFDPESGPEQSQNGGFDPDRTCCPAGGVVCSGIEGTLCCEGDTPQCCLRDSVAMCIAADACCTDVDCTLGECDFCDINDPIDSACVDRTTFCQTEYGPCSVCVNGVCADDDALCTAVDACTAPDCVSGICAITSVCTAPNATCCGDGPEDCTDTATDRFNCGACDVDCRVEVGDDGICCNGVCEDGPFCGCDRDADCETCETCISGSCVTIPESTVCANQRGAAICCSGETPGCCIRDDQPICLFGRACCDDSNCDGECSVCDVSLGSASDCIPSDAVCEELYGPGCTCNLGVCDCPTTTSTTTTTTTTTTTRDPSLCLETGSICDVANNRCCDWLGCFRQSDQSTICADCLEEDERCSDDSNCCTGLVCNSGNCLPPECRANSDCGPCEICNDDFDCVAGNAGGSCGPCMICRNHNFGNWTEFGCFPVDEESTDPLCAGVCCDGSCYAGSTCVCNAEDPCGPCFRCDENRGACVFDCRLRDATGPCCHGCQECDDAAWREGECVDLSTLCPGGGCTNCFDGVCQDDDSFCNECERCEAGRCVFDCNAAGAAECCDAGSCGRTFCRPDGTCAISEDPNDFCGPCKQCVGSEGGSFECRNVPDGTIDPTGSCPDGATHCCGGVCTSLTSCGCVDNDDCGECLTCFRGSCISDCNREGPNGPCCMGCQVCNIGSGICEDENDLCGECGDCDGGVCRDDHPDCDDCELCISGTCVFNCNNEEGPADCCEDTGSCGVADTCINDTQCQYRAEESLCTGVCERCVGPNARGGFNCTLDPECTCTEHSDCGPCATCEAGECVAVTERFPPEFEIGICCDGVLILDGECCEPSDTSEFCEYWSGRPMCTESNQCVECRSDSDCGALDQDCRNYFCDGGTCDYVDAPTGTMVPGSPGGICCGIYSRRYVEGGECCSDSDCAADEICCGHQCQPSAGACECTSDNECGPCESCVGEPGTASCVPLPDGRPRDGSGFSGVCCNGEFFEEASCCVDEDCCPFGTYDNGRCCEGDYCTPSICRVHYCVQCGSNAECSHLNNECRSAFCDEDGFCDGVYSGDGQVQNGRCCDGEFHEGAECCDDGDCDGATPYCSWNYMEDREMCSECRAHRHCQDGDPCTRGFCSDDNECSFDPIVDGFNPVGAGYCCNGVLQAEPCPTTTTTPPDECEVAGGTRLTNGTCVLRCVAPEQCDDLCGTSSACLGMVTGMACIFTGGVFIGNGCPNRTDEECPAGFACTLTHCLEVCPVAPPLPTTTTSPPTTTTPVPCNDTRFVRCSDGECRQCCGADTSNCPNVGGGDAGCYVCNANSVCQAVPTGATCVQDGTSDPGYCNSGTCESCVGNGSNCSESYTCCSGFCDLTHPQFAQCADPPSSTTTSSTIPPRTTTSTTTSTTTTTLPPCTDGMIRCPAPNGPCSQCCGSDASNCVNIDDDWDAECVVCSGNETNICVPVNEHPVCSIDTGGTGYCANGECHVCQANGVTCNGNDFVCCSRFCRPGDNRCAPPGTVCDAGTNRACYTGPAGTAGVGVCQSGLETCNPDGLAWGPCIGEVTPTGEVCDDLDNDCDGQVDEDGVCD